MAIDKEVSDLLVAGRDPEELSAKNGLTDELKKALPEWVLTAILYDHLGSEAEVGAGIIPVGRRAIPSAMPDRPACPLRS